ncbi:MAG: hypothetical protein ACYDHY_05145 [Acidiferrobacterales bacterium]
MPKHVADLAHHPALSGACLSGGDAWKSDPDGAVHEATMRPSRRSDNGDIRRAVALAGDGINLQTAQAGRNPARPD